MFYWFQNRKSRSKHKLRHLQNSNKQQNRQLLTTIAASSASPTSPTTAASAAPSCSSSSSDNKSSPKGSTGGSGLNKSCASTIFTLGPSNMTEMLDNSSKFSLSQPAPYFPTHEETHTEPFFFPSSQGFLFSEPLVPFHGQPVVGPCGSLLLSETMAHGGASKKVKMNPNVTSSSAHSISPSTASETITVPFVSSSNQVHGEKSSNCLKVVSNCNWCSLRLSCSFLANLLIYFRSFSRKYGAYFHERNCGNAVSDKNRALKLGQSRLGNKCLSNLFIQNWTNKTLSLLFSILLTNQAIDLMCLWRGKGKNHIYLPYVKLFKIGKKKNKETKQRIKLSFQTRILLPPVMECMGFAVLLFVWFFLSFDRWLVLLYGEREFLFRSSWRTGHGTGSSGD